MRYNHCVQTWWMLVFLPLVSSSLLAAQLTFRHALELAAERKAAVVPASGEQRKAYDVCSQMRLFPLSLSGIEPDSPMTPQGIPAFLFGPTAQLLSIKSAETSLVEYSEAQFSIPTHERAGDVVLCTAIAYAELGKVNAQIQVIQRQQMAAVRLVNVESQRVVARVDNPIVLTRAKLVAARARVWAAALEGEQQELRQQLADFTGLPVEAIEPVTNSMPPLPDLTYALPSVQAKLGQLAAVRDVAQLEYLLARLNRDQAKAKALLATANLGDLIAAHITEEEKFNVLLQTNFELQRARLQLLQVTGELETWALDGTGAGPGVSTLVAGGPDTIPAPTSRFSAPQALRAMPAVKSIMITPAVSTLMVGQSQQFSAIAVYSDGSAKNATSEATWRCSSNSDAIVSASGLLTALASGQVTLSATNFGITEAQRITITVDNSTPFAP